MRQQMDYYKVVTEDMKSLGLRKNPNILQFEKEKWVYEENPQPGNQGSGGIWVANGKGNAHTLKKYMQEKSVTTKLFAVEIGKILYSNSYRTKTNKVRLLYEVLN